MAKAPALRGYLIRDRDETGYYNGIPQLRGAVQSVPIGDGLSIRYCLSEDVFFGGSVCEARLLTALLCKPGDAFPVAVLEATILSKGTGRGMGIIDSCDLISESLHTIVNDLSTTSVDDFSSVLSNGGVFILDRLEVRFDSTRLGISQRLFTAITESVSRSIELCLYALKPFPLQYEYCDPGSESPEYETFWAAFCLDKEKLSNYYCYQFGCKSVSPYTRFLMSAFNGWKLSINRLGWSVFISE